MNHLAYLIIPILFSLFLLTITACSNKKPNATQEIVTTAVPAPKDCIKQVIAQDDSLGTIRNHACETIPLAKTILEYADAMERIDYSDCPPLFAAAFKKHREAWRQMIPLVEKYPDMRGEMHDLFDEMEKGEHAEEFKPLLKGIWDTWGEVEEAMK